jgi:hypothetical protein
VREEQKVNTKTERAKDSIRRDGNQAARRETVRKTVSLAFAAGSDLVEKRGVNENSAQLGTACSLALFSESMCVLQSVV